MQRRFAMMGFLGCLLAGDACVLEVDVPHWEAIEPSLVREELHAPTAALDAQSVSEFLASANIETEVARQLGYLIGNAVELEVSGTTVHDPAQAMPLIPEIPELEADDRLPEGAIDLPGTSLFLEIACPGAVGIEPDPEFGHGHLRLDSARLEAETLANLQLQSQILGSLERCEFGDHELVGTTRLFYVLETQTLIGHSQLSVASSLGPTTVDGRFAITGGRSYSTFEPSAGGTLTVVSDFESPSVTVYGSNAAMLCDVETMPPTCDIAVQF